MKNVNTGVKRFNKIKYPKLDIYVYNKPTDIYMDYVLTKDTTKHQVSYKWRKSDIATKILNIPKEIYSENIRKDRTRSKALDLNKNIFGVDINIEDQALMKYMDGFDRYIGSDGYHVYEDTPPIRNIHKGYLDMEWDILETEEQEDQPIYLITYIDGLHKVCYTYYLYDSKYGGIDELADKEKIIKRIKNNVNDHIRIDNLDLKPDVAEKVQPILQNIADRMQYIITRYDDEANMIQDMYQLVFRKYKPDFLTIYNAEADIGQAIRRYEGFGRDIKDLFTCPEIGDYINFDMSSDKFEPHERNHTYDCASYTKILCSYQLYHTLRRTTKYASRGLGDTALREIGVSKLDFSHICSTLHELPHRDFITALEYNIRDVILMDFLESCLNDIEYVMSLRFLKTVDYNRVFIPIVGVYNVFYHISLRNGKVMGNNVNRILKNLTDDEMEYFKKKDPITYKLAMAIKAKKKIDGGLCSDPNKFRGKGRKDMLSFLSSAVLKHVIDMDAKSEYPNAIITGMMGRSCIYGRIKAINLEDVSDKDMYIYTQAMINRDVIAICKNFFNLLGVSDIMREFGIKIPKPKKRSTLNKDIDIVNTIFDKDRYNNISKILSKVLNPKQDAKDKDIGETPMRGVFLVNREDIVSFKYFSSKVSYVLKNKETGKPVQTLDYLNYTGDEDTLVVDIVNKEINNNILDDIRIDVKNVNEIHSKPLEYINTMEIKDIATICNPKKLLKSQIVMNNTTLSIPSRFIAFPYSLAKTNLHKDIKTMSSIPKETIYFIDSKDVSFNIMSDSLTLDDNSDLYIDSDGVYRLKEGVIETTVSFTNNKNKSKSFKLIRLSLNYSVYHVMDIPEDNVYKGVFSYAIDVDDSHSLEFKQEFFFINFK